MASTANLQVIPALGWSVFLLLQASASLAAPSSTAHPVQPTVAQSGPALAAETLRLRLILLRHADKDRQRGDYNLSPAGFARAMALARLIPACFGMPSEITTYALDPNTSKNARSYQSAVPLAVATGMPIRIAMNAQDHSFQVGRDIRHRQTQPNELLVLFWEHRRLPELARGLGWSAMRPIAEDDFDQLFLFRFPVSGGDPEVTTFRQSDLIQRPCYTQTRLPMAEPLRRFSVDQRP